MVSTTPAHFPIITSRSSVARELTGCIVSVMNAIRDNRGPDEEVKPDGSAPNFLVKDCEIHFMAFDILYRQDRSVMNMPLRERKKILDTTLGDPGDGTPLAGAKGRLNGVVGKIWKVILGAAACAPSSAVPALGRCFEALAFRGRTAAATPLRFRPEYLLHTARGSAAVHLVTAPLNAPPVLPRRHALVRRVHEQAGHRHLLAGEDLRGRGGHRRQELRVQVVGAPSPPGAPALRCCQQFRQRQHRPADIDAA